MWISSITLNNFRNYNHCQTDFSPDLNIFLGKNAQGKTNILEAIYFLSLTRSHRTRQDKELIHFQEKQLTVSGTVAKQSGEIPLEVTLTQKGRVTKVNHLKQNKLSDYIGNMTVVLFAPEDLQLIKGSPALRRKFMDIDLGQIKPLYLSDLAQYNHVLKQRNSYLKSVDNIDKDFLAVLDQQLSYYGSRVMKHRLEFIMTIQHYAQEHQYSLSSQTENLKINYLPSFTFSDTDQLENLFLQALQKQHQRDIFKKNTSIGPHRDDIDFFINDINASFCSQGQHRSLILSLKMAEIDIIKEGTGESPILLLDDVMSELDNTRQLKLLENIQKNVQTFVTTTSLEHLHHLPSNLKIFTVTKGKLTEKKA